MQFIARHTIEGAHSNTAALPLPLQNEGPPAVEFCVLSSWSHQLDGVTSDIHYIDSVLLSPEQLETFAARYNRPAAPP